MLIATLEDARLTKNNIYLTNIDFQKAFSSIDHVRPLAIVGDLGYPKDMIL